MSPRVSDAHRRKVVAVVGGAIKVSEGFDLVHLCGAGWVDSKD